ISYIMDYGYNCKYEVVKNVFNTLQNDSIEFVAYDHYGRPNFETPEYVLLYISKDDKKNIYYHQKYQFDILKRNATGTFYGYSYTIKQKKRSTVLKNKKVTSLEDLFKIKQAQAFKDLFK